MNWYHKGCHPVLFWVKEALVGAWWPVMWKVSAPFGPKLHEPSSYIIQA